MKKSKAKKIKKKETIADLIKNNPEAERILNEEGLLCSDCPYAIYESVEQGAAVHGLDAKKILKKLKKTN